MNIGVIVGRFQSPYLTDGHKTLIRAAYKENEQVAIYLLNNEISFSDANPLPYDLRERMITDFVKREFKEKATQFFALSDQRYASIMMFAIDESLLGRYSNLAKFTMYGGPRSFAEVYKGIAEVKIIDEDFHSNRSRDARNEAYDLESIKVDFLQGVIHALNYRRAVCHNYIVSVLFVEEGGKSYCLAKNDTRAKKYVLPLHPVVSAFDNFESQSRAESKRELGSESVISEGTHVLSVKADDWRFRNNSDFCYYHIVMHHAFKGQYGVTWLPIELPLKPEDFEDEFLPVIQEIKRVRP